MLRDGNIRFINDWTFEEADAPADRSRPLEWRRSFNTIFFIANRPSVEYLYSINEVDHFSQLRTEQSSDGHCDIIDPALKRRLRIVFEVSQVDMHDRLYFSSETEKGSGIYQLNRTKDPIKITITSAEPTERKGPYASGSFGGMALHDTYNRGSDCLVFDLSAPEHFLEQIVSELKSIKECAVHVGISIQSFSFEVDDALREWYHSRDLFIHGDVAPAVVSTLRLVTRDPVEATSALLPPIERDESENDGERFSPPIPDQEMPRADYSKALSGIKTAMWAIAIALVIHLFK